jgi:hypothetical protein
MPIILPAIDIDDTTNLIDSIQKELLALEASYDSLKADAGKLKDKSQQLGMKFSLPSTTQGTLMAACNIFGHSAGGRTQDIELLISENRLSHILDTFNMEPITFKTEDYTIKATPVSKPRAYWNYWAPRPMSDCFYVRTSWNILLPNMPEKRVNIYHQLSVNMQAIHEGISFLEVCAPRFYDENMKLIDNFFGDFPQQNGIRSRLKQSFFQKVSALIGKFKAEFPASLSSTLPANSLPHFYHISDTLGFAVRTLPFKRKQYFPLWRNSIFYDLGVRIKSEHITPHIRKTIVEQGLDFQAINFEKDFINIKIHKEIIKLFFPVVVKVNIWLDYKAFLFQEKPGRLSAFAQWEHRHLEVGAYNCGPFCGKIADEALKTAKEELDHLPPFIIPFKDFSTWARNVISDIDSFGVLISLQLSSSN